LFEDIIKKHSNEGDLVLDTFLGGGTTAFASMNTGRRCIGSELDPVYYDKLKKWTDM
jgi:DNA modification methylase